MTTLDSFLEFLPDDVQLLDGHQQTPNTIFLSFTEEEFLKILNHQLVNKFSFRYLEEKHPPNILIHLFFTHNDGNIQVSINVKNRTAEFNQQITKLFPSAALYLESIE
ncbi:hypothetical protein CEE45_04670 [Candidatus Heimdallarchaeota archaeon B3_Heim]|nr:MAG: hypothetical protein CEE45_04670 [Candidatus Heimdallarchaeota archaeon B3_Heim]